MPEQDYQRVEKAIHFLVANAARQPSLEEVAAEVSLSPFHFQRMFSRWAGTTPKRFLQVLTLEHGKRLLEDSQPLLEAAYTLGLSGSSRLHDHFVQLQAITPGQHGSGGRGLLIEYGVHETPFGSMLLAATPRGICRAAFLDYDSLESQLEELQASWPHARLQRAQARTSALVDSIFTGRQEREDRPLSLLVTGTNFQVAVWRALLEIPEGAVTTYGELAKRLGRPGAGRAVGNAIGANPVAFLIPCHRVIRESGALGGYRWGAGRKQAIQAWERLRAADPA